MKRQLYRIALYSILTYLGLSAPNSAGAASQPSGVNGPHFCGFTEQPGNRRYARSFAANLNVGEPRTVRMIYFLPNDRPYDADVVQKMKDEIRTAQSFFAEQMQAHGYGEMTFRFETNPQGEPTVHRVDGRHPDSYYLNPNQMFDEIHQVYNLYVNIYLIVIDNSGEVVNQDGAKGIGGRLGRSGGFAIVHEEFYRDLAGKLAAHELGHAFGLGHDFRDDAYLISYGPGLNRLSACSAEFLSVHPYFNPAVPIEAGPSPTIELISSTQFPAGSKSVLVQLKVSDSEGLHQAQLFGNWSEGLIACRGLAGEKDTVVEFEYDGVFKFDGYFKSISDSVAHEINVEVIDTDWNIGYASFGLVKFSPHHIGTLRPGAIVTSVSFSPDGVVAAGLSDGTIKLWDIATQQNIGTLPGHTKRVTSVAFSRDGTTLASGSHDETVKLWNVATGANFADLRHTARVISVAISSDGVVAAGSWDGTIKLWDVATQQNIATLEEHTDSVTSVSFSRDGTILASGSYDRTVKLWNVATGANFADLRPGAIVTSVSLSSDGVVAAASSLTVKLWDVGTQQDIGTLRHTGSFNSVAFSSDGVIAAGSWDGTVKLWDAATGANVVSLGVTGRVESVVFSPDGRTLVAGTLAGTVELWDASGLMGVRREALTEIDIPASNLRAAIASALGKPPSGPIVRGHLENLTDLVAQNANISDLTGLEGATNLRILDLGAEYVEAENRLINSNSVSDITPLAGLTNLTDLHLRNNSVSDISAVSGLTNLRTLDLNRNSISDISPLVENTGLAGSDEVHLRENPLNYQSIHTHIPALQSRGVTVEFDNRTVTTLLNISGVITASNNILTVEVRDSNGRIFEGVPVTFAVISGGGTLSVTNTTTDENGRAQSTLTLGTESNRVTVSAVGAEQTATFSDVAEAGVHILDPNLRAAIGAALDVTPGDPISPEEMATLTHFKARDWTEGASISLLTGLEFATNLTELRLGNNSITDISPLSGLTNLRTLGLGRNSVTDISPLSGLTNLRTLGLSNNGIEDVSTFVEVLSGLTNLTNLHLSGNHITDISFLSGLTGLTVLRLEYNGITDISPLSGSTDLTELRLSGNNITDISPLSGLTNLTRLELPSGITDVPVIVRILSRLPHLTSLSLSDNNIEDVSALIPVLSDLTDLRDLNLSSNRITDLSPLAELTNLTSLNLWGNNISDISPLVENTGLRSGGWRWVGVRENPLSYQSIHTHIPILQNRGVTVDFDNQAHPALLKISGDNQRRTPGETLVNPFVVEVHDESGLVLAGISVTFTVISGDGTLSIQSTITNAEGRAQSTLTLGPNLGTYTVQVSAVGIEVPATFNAEGNRIPETLDIISGADQEGLPGDALEKPFVVEVRDADGSELEGVPVTFTITAGGGTLSTQTTTTNSNGRAKSILTLGPNPGTNTVTVSVTGSQKTRTFTAEGNRIPKALEIISGKDQAGLPGDALEKPFVVEVRDQFDKPLPDVEVTFSVSSGDGTLSATSATTDSNGRAESTLTLGPNPGTNTVEATVTGIEEKRAFNAEGTQIPKTLEIVSGAEQEGIPGAALEKPFVVEVRDQTNKPLPGVEVTFSVSSGDGTLSATSATTDSNGRAESTLTLGPNPGTNTVEATVTGIAEKRTFNAEGTRIPKTLEIISGIDQAGLPGDALEKAFVVEVHDQTDKPFPGVEVTFTVTAGGGKVQPEIATTDENGRAESTLTLGPNPGTNTVEATVTGIAEKRTFNAEGIRIPKTLEIISGVDQAGLPGDVLEKAFVVEVRDQTDKPLPGVEVTFSVSSGDGTLSATSATTDSNGRAESTLTLGSTPGANTVRVSVEGNTQAVAFLTIESARTPMFTLAIPAGAHAIHIPLAVKQINGEDAVLETVGDLYNTLGDAVSYIITVGDDGGWKTYLGNLSAGTAADAAIGDDTGLIVVMSDAKTLELAGDMLGTAGASMINIDVGNNLVGLPLKPSAGLSMISDLLVDGVGAIAVSKADGLGFHTIREPGQDGDGPIVGGVGYLVVYIGTEATSIPIVGSAWENSGAVAAAPAVAFDGTHTPVLYVEGGVIDDYDMLSRIPELRVTVKNLSTGASLDTVLGTELSTTAYSATFVELSRHAAKVGEVLEIVAHSPNPFVGVRPVPQIVVSAEKVLTSRISLPDLELYEIPSETVLLANYPNPFNPETWIPYRLAKAAEVTLDIYDTNGRLVRTIDIGFKPAAVYESRASAIYWDGRNNQGESVASGVYFYHLSAGAYSATRKMLIMK